MESLIRRIKDFNSNRIPDMLQLKYKGMKENMFRFYRGTNHLFYEDLMADQTIPPAPNAWISGDLHLENFGSFRSENKQVYFDLNDFDEAILAPVTWELARMLTSIFVAFESLKIEEKRAIKMARLFLKSYARTLAAGKARYIEPNTAQGIVRDFLSSVSKRKQKAILEKRTTVKKDKLAILMDDPRHFEIEKGLKKELFAHIQQWLGTDEASPYNYRVTDGVFRLAGTGSVGLKRYAFLLKTLNKVGEKYLLIDMKQAVPSSLLPFVSVVQPVWESEALRITSIQQTMQNWSPALISTSAFRGDTFVMQEMQPTKDSINFKQIRNQYRDMYQVIDDMAMLTASSQLRSSGQQGSAITDDLKKFGADETWQEIILQYALQYSLTVKRYYGGFLAAYKGGSLMVDS
jgi:uncharacterized protein (DUF2252 family)